MSKKAMLLGALFAAAILVSGQVYAEDAAPKADAQTEQTAEGQPAPGTETEASADAAAAAAVEPAAGEEVAPEGETPAAAEEIKLPRKGN